MKFERKEGGGSSIESKSILSAFPPSPPLSLSPLSLVSAYARVITVECVSKGTVASHRFSRTCGGPYGVERGSRIRSAESQGIYVGNAGDLLSDIRYSLLFLRRSSSLFCLLRCLFVHPLSCSTSRFSLPHDSCMCFVCITVCNVWALRYLSYGRGRRSRTANGDIRCIQRSPPLTAPPNHGNFKSAM